MTIGDERDRLLHELANMVQVVLTNLDPLDDHVTTPEGQEIMGDIRGACERCIPVFERLRKIYKG